MRKGRPLTPLSIAVGDRAQLVAWSKRPKTAQALAMRARIVLLGTPPPNGGASTIGTNQYVSTALGPWDNTTYGNFNYDVKRGWSNDNALQVNYQRQFHRGFAYQFEYVWSRPFRLGGNSTRDSVVLTSQSFVSGSAATMLPTWGAPVAAALPPHPPAGVPSYGDWKGLDKFEEYQIDTGIPQQHFQMNNPAASSGVSQNSVS